MRSNYRAVQGERTERRWMQFGSAAARRRRRGDVACGERGCVDVHQMGGNGTTARRHGGEVVRAQQQGRVGCSGGKQTWCGRGRCGSGCGQTVTHGGDGGAGARRGRGAARRDRRAEQGQWQGGCGCMTCMARGEQGQTRGEHLGVGAGDASGGASGIWKWGGESARWQRGGGTGHGRGEESGEVAGVGWDRTGQAAHGEREQQRRGDRTGCARRVGSRQRRGGIGRAWGRGRGRGRSGGRRGRRCWGGTDGVGGDGCVLEVNAR
jgi:hypothetical protein